MVSSLGVPFTMRIRFQHPANGTEEKYIFVKVKGETTALSIRTAISHLKFDDTSIFLTANYRMIQDDEMAHSFKNLNLYAGFNPGNI